MNPLIGLTGNHSDIDVTLRDAYHKQIVRAGGVPVIIPPVDDEQVIIDTLERLDGIIFTGGGILGWILKGIGSVFELLLEGWGSCLSIIVWIIVIFLFLIVLGL